MLDLNRTLRCTQLTQPVIFVINDFRSGNDCARNMMNRRTNETLEAGNVNAVPA
ncbi:hypothetical protein AB4851_16760 [Burkholderia sp. 22PA0099]|uniref:hypothetical protein n=1 Tax=Burkholderia sp. 22PA0099 TaxID=3237372 RepID=UPI0039C4A6EC